MSELYQELRDLRDILSGEPNKEELKNCIETFVKYIQNQRKIKCPREPESWWFDKVISIAEGLMLVLENIFSINIVASIFSAVFNITSKLLRSDIFNDLVEYNLFLDLKKAVNTLQRSLVYLVGVYKDIIQNASNLSKRKEIADDIGSNFNIHTGCNEIEPLRAEIENISSSQYLTDSMMEKIEWYCFVSLILELNYLLAIELKNKVGKSSAGFSRVLESRRREDRTLLPFLYKPNKDTLKLFLQYIFEIKWPLVNSFLKGRGLLVDNFTKRDIHDGVFQIVNADDPSIRLSLHDCVFFFCMRAHRNTIGRKTYFKIECQENGGGVHIRCLQHNNYLVSRHAWTRADLDTPGSNNENVDWRLVKVEREEDSDSFVIVAKSTENSCIYYDDTGRVHDKAYDPSDVRCFWRLQPVDRKMYDMRYVLRRIFPAFYRNNAY